MALTEQKIQGKWHRHREKDAQQTIQRHRELMLINIPT